MKRRTMMLRRRRRKLASRGRGTPTLTEASSGC
jgi:hypothetical protein